MRFPKFSIIICGVGFAFINPSICYSQFLRINTPWNMEIKFEVDTLRFEELEINVIQDTTPEGIITFKLDSTKIETFKVDTIAIDTLHPFVFGLSVGLDFFIRESKSGSYKTGIIPGVGYGIKYKPVWWKRTNHFLGLDMFVQGLLADEIETHEGHDYFNLDILPVLTLIDWIGIGYGLRIKIGLEGIPSEKCFLFSFGIKKATS